METTSQEKIEITIAYLNDLTEIHNDRMIGYEKAISETDDEDLVTIFTTMAALSRSFKTDLIKGITLFGGQIHHLAKFSGRYYNAWMELKAALDGKNKNEIVRACEIEEHITLNTYKAILSSNENIITGEMKRLIEMQMGELEFAYGRLSALKSSGRAN